MLKFNLLTHMLLEAQSLLLAPLLLMCVSLSFTADCNLLPSAISSINSGCGGVV